VYTHTHTHIYIYILSFLSVCSSCCCVVVVVVVVGRLWQATNVLQPAGLLYRPLWTFQLFATRCPAPTDAFRPLAAEVGTMSGNRSINFAEMPTSTVHLGIFYMPQICDMEPTALLPFRRKACLRIFPLLKSDGFGRV
jgi:hypothetical protein